MRVLLFGNGKMCNMVKDIIMGSDDLILAGVIDVGDIGSLPDTGKIADVIVDFSHPDMLEAMAQYALRTGTPIVTGTTGYEQQHLDRLRAISAAVPVLQSYNFSFGIALFKYVLTSIRDMLPDEFDVELIEAHHNRKIDAPSGTAKMLLAAIDPNDECEKVYGRYGICGARKKKSIGVHAIRGGTVAGEHTVCFMGNDEIFEITHKASSRRIFAEGALNAARKLVTLSPGLYSMDDIIKN